MGPFGQKKDIDAPPVTGNRWVKGPEDFAVRVDAADLEGLFKRELLVEAGTRALLLVEGRAEQGELGPGTYNLQSSGLTGAARASAVLVDNGAVDLKLSIPDLFTADPLRVTLDLVLVLRLKSATAFLTNLMKQRRSYALAELRDYLFDEAQNAAAVELAQVKMAGVGDLAFNERLTTALTVRLRRSLERVGIGLEQLRSVSARHKGWEAGRDEDEALVLEEAAAVRAEQRLQTLQRMLNVLHSERAADLAHQGSLLDLLKEQDAQGLIREDELAGLRREIQEAGEDRALERRFALRILELRKQLELDKQQLQGDEERLQLRLRLRDAELRGQLAEERLARVEGQKIDTCVAIGKLEQDLAQARGDAEREAITLETMRLKFELGQQALETMRLGRHRDAERKLELDLKRQDADMERDLKSSRAQQEIEAARLAAHSQASPTAQIAVAGPEQAALLAELQRTVALRGLTPDAIMALAAERSPQVAQAFTERAQAADGEAFLARVEALYERALGRQEAGQQQQAELQRSAMEMLKALAERALDTQRDTAVAAARATPGGHPAGAGEASPNPATGQQPPGRVALCRNCGMESAIGVKFCHNCGERFFTEAGHA